MKTAWREGAVDKSVVAPVSLIVSAFARVGEHAHAGAAADERPTSLC